jgi:hypothetical protein
MALTYDLTAIADWSDLTKGAEWSKTEALIFATMSIGMDEITADNAGEFYARIKILEGAIESFVSVIEDGDMRSYFFTVEDITRRIGLSTNGGRETRAKFLGRMLNIRINDFERTMKRQLISA